jgi:hypothetical protein
MGNTGIIRDIILSLCIMVVSIAVIVESQNIRPPVFEKLGAATVPQIVAVALAFLALVILLDRIREGFRTTISKTTKEQIASRPIMALTVFFLICFYIASMQFGYLGFRTATFLFITISGCVLIRFRFKSLLIVLPLSSLMAIGCHYIFTQIFVVDLP